MAEKKMTRKDALEFAIEALKNFTDFPGDAKEKDDAIAALKRMYEQVSKPRKKSDTPSKTRLINENLAKACIEAMEGHDKVTGKWLLEHVKGWPTATPQKATAVMKIAVDDGRAVRIKEGKNVYYSLAE